MRHRRIGVPIRSRVVDLESDRPCPKYTVRLVDLIAESTVRGVDPAGFDEDAQLFGFRKIEGLDALDRLETLTYACGIFRVDAGDDTDYDEIAFHGLHLGREPCLHVELIEGVPFSARLQFPPGLRVHPNGRSGRDGVRQEIWTDKNESKSTQRAVIGP